MLLEHLVYTCRVAYETIARSPGIPPAVQRMLEDRAGAYPSGDWGADAPLVFRGFPLQPDGTFAAMLLRYSGTDYAGRLGNHLAHGFVIRPDQLAEAADNLAWIAVHLPIWLGYRARANVDAIAPIAIAIDPLEQLRFLRFAVHELSPAVAVDLANRVIARLSLEAPAAPLALPFGPPAPTLADHLRLVCSGDEPPPPPPELEVLHLWRLAGLLALLPRAYQRRVSFSLNEIEAPAGYALTVLRDAAAVPAAAGDGGRSAFVAHAVALVQADDLEGLARLLRWLAEPLTAPSPPALDACLGFYRAVVEPDATGTPPQPEAVVAALRALRASIRHLVYAPFEAAILRLRRGLHRGTAWWLRELCVLSDLAGGAPSETLLAVVLEALEITPTMTTDEIAAVEQTFADLPPRLRAAVWSAAERRGVFPVPATHGGERALLLASLRAAGQAWPDLDGEARRSAHDRFAAACVASLTEPALATRLGDLITLLSAVPVAPALRRPLLRHVVAAMSEPGPGGPSRQDLASSLVYLLGTHPPAPGSAGVVAELVDLLADHDAGLVARALLARPVDRSSRGAVLERVRAIADTARDRRLKELAEVQCELLRATMNELEVAPGPSELVVSMPRFERWTTPRPPRPFARRDHGEYDDTVDELVAQLEADMRTMEPGLAILIADACLRARPALPGLLATALVRVEQKASETAAWLSPRAHFTAGREEVSPSLAFATLLRRAAHEGATFERQALEVAAIVRAHLHGQDGVEVWRRVHRAWEAEERLPRPWRDLFPWLPPHAPRGPR